MAKTILITGSTDGIGLMTAEMLAAKGHRILLHGRSLEKLAAAALSVEKAAAQSGPAGHGPAGGVESFRADLSKLHEVEAMATAVATRPGPLDVLINNAGVFNTPQTTTEDGLDIRFVVNTIAPYLLTKRLMPRLGSDARVVNLSSAAQAPVDLRALTGPSRLADMEAYAQSKLALTMWSTSLAQSLGPGGPVVFSVNPGSMLGTKMVKKAFGVSGGDVRKGAEILCRAALNEEFAGAAGRYFDNDSGRFAPPHRAALDPSKCQEVVHAIDSYLASVGKA